MRNSAFLLSAIVLIALMASISTAAIVGSASIRAPAVILFNNTGSLTAISLTITNGNGNVTFANVSTVANSTLDSAQIAAQYGSYYAGKNFSKYNFEYAIDDDGGNVSGPSAGAAMALLAISAFDGKPINPHLTITGTINPNGGIGVIGGAIDKVGAAKASGLSFVLVPWVSPGSITQGIYYIAQTKYDIPLVEVSNISQAASYAFNGASALGRGVSINFSVNYMTSTLAQSMLNCSDVCDEAPFAAFSNYTLNLTESQIANLSAMPGFGAAAGELMNITNQASAIHQKGYLYISADISFLDYLNAFYLSSSNFTRDGALGYMQRVQSSCSDLVAPQLTFNNYEYIIGAQLRQGWANYTINSTLAGYNTTGSTTDDIVESMYSAGQAQAWCGAVSFLYDYPYKGSSEAATFSASLSQIAAERINRAATDTGLYLTLAKQAYSEGNYPVAIIDADYAYVLTSAGSRPGVNPSDLANESVALASNSSYGVWATEFSKEAVFYAYEARATKNATLAGYYADQAYSSASLAFQVSNDTSNIYNSLVIAPEQTAVPVTSTNVNGSYGSEDTYLLQNLAMQVAQLKIIVGVLLALIMGCTLFLGILVRKLSQLSAAERKRGRRAAK